MINKLNHTSSPSRSHLIVYYQIDGFVQDCSISSALAVEILQSCTNPSKWSCSYPVCQSADTLSLRLVWAARFQILTYNYASHKTQSNETSLWYCNPDTYDVLTVVLLLLYSTWTQTLTTQWLHDFMMKSFECSVLAFASLTPFQFNWLVEVHIIHVLWFIMVFKILHITYCGQRLISFL